nr:hypothetical protein [Enterobacter asburiae]
MSTITREFTKEQLQQIIETDHVQCGEASALARIALASLEAEAVCVIDQSNLDYLKSGSDADVWPASRAEMGDVLLYRSATPAPVSVPAAMEMDDDFDSAFEHGKAVGWNAYRAAMLQGAEPVTTDYKLPFDQWLSQQTGTIDVECGCVMTEVFFHWLRVAYEAGNYPVIPDGWVLVPIEPTPDMREAYHQAQAEYEDVDGLWSPDHQWQAMHAAAPEFREIVNSSTNNCRENAETSTKCWCHTCRPVTFSDSRFVVCPVCGNKRCPHANDHRNACTGSNEPGQEGSAYPAAPQQEVKP